MSYAGEGDKRQKLIQWDEETIAEHDRERGTRQKIDEAPTPYRYLSESDHSENECESDHSYSSDGAKKVKHKARFICPEDGKEHYISPPQKASSSVIDSWQTINAKLNYEKHLQDIADGRAPVQDHYLVSGVGGLSPTSLSTSTSTSTSKRNGGGSTVDNEGNDSDENNVSMTCSADDEDGEDDYGEHSPNSERRTEFGELVEAEAALNTRLNKKIGLITHAHIHSHSSQPGSATNSNRNSATRTSSKDSSGGTNPLSILPPSSTSPRSTVFTKASPLGSTGTSTAGTHKRSGGGGGSGAHSILKHHSRFSSGSGNHSPQVSGGTVMGSTNNATGGTTQAHHSSGHHHHQHHPQTIHFSNNSPLGSPFPGSSSRNPSTDNVFVASSPVSQNQSIFAGLNGSIGGSTHHMNHARVGGHHPHHNQGSSNGSMSGIASAAGQAHSDDDDEESRPAVVAQFKNKRAGHYNEFKVLQAMRKKMMEEPDSDEDDDIAPSPVPSAGGKRKSDSFDQITTGGSRGISAGDGGGGGGSSNTVQNISGSNGQNTSNSNSSGSGSGSGSGHA